ncbi:hypothetical protein H9M94_02865 [Mycoplasma sp. Pen4]|uniref:hypothetical protein n=1 Tax=Mycoplasma sp. Pen4 TaxID=640330 RepID=UPI0016541C6D|nr:hypothetical protein [Mycoplasma sp. Pen4]QNM93528.1 hypothetical protein H9M94_02865 [Mycoplasma sp. Pen4]
MQDIEKMNQYKFNLNKLKILTLVDIFILVPYILIYILFSFIEGIYAYYATVISLLVISLLAFASFIVVKIMVIVNLIQVLRMKNLNFNNMTNTRMIFTLMIVGIISSIVLLIGVFMELDNVEKISNGAKTTQPEDTHETYSIKE